MTNVNTKLEDAIQSATEAIDYLKCEATYKDLVEAVDVMAVRLELNTRDGFIQLKESYTSEEDRQNIMAIPDNQDANLSYGDIVLLLESDDDRGVFHEIFQSLTFKYLLDQGFKEDEFDSKEEQKTYLRGEIDDRVKSIEEGEQLTLEDILFGNSDATDSFTL